MDIALHVSGLSDKNVGRLRDAYFAMEDDQIVVAVFTRNGSGNRECYNDSECDIDNVTEYTCCGCIITNADEIFLNFIRDEDDDCDCTYATMYFSILPEYKEEVQKLIEKHPDILNHESFGDRFEKVMAAMQNRK